MNYATVAHADAYFASRLGGDRWSQLTPEKKLAAIVSASDRMSLYAAQNGGWKSRWQSETTVPEAVRYVCCEEALRLTDDAAQARAEMIRQGVRGVSIGGGSESYGENARAHLLNWYGSVTLLKPFLLGRSRVVSIA